ncbi:hypothetical protein B0H14DRAFT_3043239 [Mycena olivaceomarginata]|nr:hypothetical protein B0H14DRAFT_3043239 [Mycena olivaceomarginata]
MAPAKRRVSYIIPAPTDPFPRLLLPPQNASRVGLVHPLLIPDPVQPLLESTTTLVRATRAISTSTQLSARTSPEGILYTAGRDGLVLSWDLGLSLCPRTPSDVSARRGRWESLTGWADDAIDEEAEEPEERSTSDGDILGDVAALSARRRRPSGTHELPYEDRWELDPDATHRPSSFRQCVQTHTDWVNDILLCNYNQTRDRVRSSDGTVQAWTPHATNAPDPSTIGTHSDYVRCLAACRTQNWIASGSFDRTIKLWDLNRAQSNPDPLITLNPADPHAAKSSVYALAADPFGHAIASGGPERVVRMWDPRTGKRSGKLDAKYLLTGSADASIKLWSLATQRVWSLFSAHPTLETFYAGDRAGLVSRVDVSRTTGDIGEGECVLWETPTYSDLSPGKSMGHGQSQNLGQGGINKLVVVDDALVWTATSASTVRRWRIPARGSTSATGTPGAGYGYNLTPNDAAEPEWDLREGRSLAPSVLSYDDEADDDGGETRHGIPYASLVRLTSPNDPFPVRGAGGGARDRDAEVATPPRVPLARRVLCEPARACTGCDGIDCGGTRAGTGLVLNDRVHAVSVDTGGEVGVWDLVRGVCVGVYGREALGWDASPSAGAATRHEEWSPREALERAVVGPWATVDTKAGVLASEIYADEVGYAGDRRFGDEAKLNIGKWVLRNLFLGFIREEQRTRRPRPDSGRSQDSSAAHHGSSHHHHQHRASLSSDTSARRSSSSNSTVVSSPKMLPAVLPAVASTAPQSTSPLLTPLIPLHGRPGSAAGTGAAGLLAMPSIPGSPAIGANDATSMPMSMQPQRRTRTGTLENGGGKDKDKDASDYFGSRARHVSIQGGTAPSGPDDFSGWSGPGSASNQTPSTPTGLMGRLKSFGKLKRAVDVATPALPTTVEVPVAEEFYRSPLRKTPLQLLLAGPLTPPPSSEAPTLGLSPHILLLIEEEAAPGFTTVYRGTESMPLWLAEYLLLHRMPSTPPQIKISFVLLPWVGKDSSEEQLPELLNTTQSKLTASRFLRVRKLVAHVQEKLEKMDHPTPSDAPRPRAEDLYEILCNDVVLPLDMSIAAVRQYVWRQSTELTMCYRRNREMAAYRRSRGR